MNIPRRFKAKVWMNQKGGVGKSILSYNDAFFLAESGKRTLYLDGDEQGNGSKRLAEYAVPGLVTSDLFKEGALTPIVPVDGQNLYVLMADDALIKAERTDIDDGEMVTLLRKNLDIIAQDFDYVVIDTAGSNSRIANAFLVASDYVAIPFRVDPFSIDVAKKVLTRVAFVQQKWNPNLVNLGIVPNEFDSGQPAQVDWLKQLVGAYRPFLTAGLVNKSVSYKEAALEGVPVWKLRGGDGESSSPVKTAARLAGKEVKAVFQIMLDRMEKANG
jgi:chromosome partitioning protein